MKYNSCNRLKYFFREAINVQKIQKIQVKKILYKGKNNG